MRLPHDIDIHTHAGSPRMDSVVCVDPVDVENLPDGKGLISVGIHPWNADRVTEETWRRMGLWLDDERVVAVGEAGLDALRGPVDKVQEGVFLRQARMALERDLPLVIHCVRRFDSLLKMRKEFPAEHQWVVHGFRGKPEQARQLLNAGLDLSFGPRHNAESFALTPPERRYTETDLTLPSESGEGAV